MSCSDAKTCQMVLGVCTYNRGAAIRRTLEALVIASRACKHVSRIVVVDNKSTDNTACVVDAFIFEHGDVRIERIYEPVPGKTNAMIRLMDETDEPVIAMVDDDVIIDSTWALCIVKVFAENDAAGAVGGQIELDFESGPTRIAEIYRRSFGEQDLGNEGRRLDGYGEFLVGAALAVRREAVLASGWLSDRVLECRRGAVLEGGEDAELTLRIRKAGYGLVYEPCAKAKHLIPASRQSKAYVARLRRSICRTEPILRWIQKPGIAGEIDKHARRARRLMYKTLLTDLRPLRRGVRLSERRGRVEGWQRLREMLSALAELKGENHRAHVSGEAARNGRG